MVSFIVFRFFPLTGIEGSRNAVRVNRSGEHVAGDLMIRGVGHQRWRHGVENRKRIKEKSSIQKSLRVKRTSGNALVFKYCFSGSAAGRLAESRPAFGTVPL